MKAYRIAIIALVAALNVLIIMHPAVAMEAARRGLSLWFNNVLPGILPFVIGANVLMALGAVSFLGLFLSPVMTKVFKISGRGGFALAMGLISGYPIGTKIVCEMRARGELEKGEAQRLLGFSNNAGPLFILGAVAAGLFGAPVFGYFLLVTHYLGALAVGLVLRLFAKKDDAGSIAAKNPAVIAISKNSFGQILGQSVKNAMETMLIVGGFIVLFSVISALLESTGVFGLVPFQSPYHPAIFGGIIEMTGGLGTLSDHGLSRAIATIAAALLSFGGLSILFQSINFIGKTDLRAGLYALCKLGHASASGLLAWLAYPLFSSAIENSQAAEVFAPTAARTFINSATFFIVATAVLLAISILIFVLKSTKRR
ncbi:MAG: hypothetical protein FWC67_02605 [Defluviitaleaceae bacterium]|nr:hypothetical protein [Defluviitaleaceae bacterium]